MPPVAAPVEDAGMPLRLSGHADRRPRAGDDHAVRHDRLARRERQPPLPALDAEPDDLIGDDLGRHPLRDVAQVAAPLPVRGAQPAAINPVGVKAVPDQVLVPAVRRHRRVNRGRGRAPAAGVGEANVLLRRRAQRQQAIGVALLAGPVPRDGAPVDEQNARGAQPRSREGTRLSGDGNSLRPGTDRRQRRHDRENRPPARPPG